MRVLVTGATGFLGNWITRRLVEMGDQVRIIKRPSTPIGDLGGLSLDVRPGDVLDRPSLETACEGVDLVYHLAGLVAYSRAERAAMEQVNVQGTKNVLEACKARGVGRLLHASSVVTIGASRTPIALNEDSTNPIADLRLGYFDTKLQAEKLVLEADRRGEIEAYLINPATIYGPGDARKGSRATQLKVVAGRFPFYPPGGVNIVHIDDVVDMTIKICQARARGKRYIISGENVTIKDLFVRLAGLAGVRPPLIPLSRRAIFAMGRMGDALERIGQKGPLNSETAWTSTLYHWFEPKNITAEFGFRPRSADEALALSVRWILSQKRAGS
jgi:dihydroflavonol-4-reductase